MSSFSREPTCTGSGWVIGLIIGLIVVAVESTGIAQCTKDVDCKGTRVCIDGVCQEPAASSAPVTPADVPISPTVPGKAVPSTAEVKSVTPTAQVQPTPPPDTQPPPVTSSARVPEPSTGWALPASIIGFVAGPLVLGFSIYSADLTAQSHDEYDGFGSYAAAEEHETESWVFGISALLTTAAFGPVVFAGGRSARRHPDVDGARAFRIIGWSNYGASLGCAMAMVAVGLADERVPPALIGITGALGSLSLISFAIDALIARGEAKALIEPSAKTRTHRARIFPTVTPLAAREETTGLMVGLGGRF